MDDSLDDLLVEVSDWTPSHAGRHVNEPRRRQWITNVYALFRTRQNLFNICYTKLISSKSRSWTVNMKIISHEPWWTSTPMWTRTRSIQLFIVIVGEVLTLPANCTKNLVFLETSVVYQKYEKCRNIWDRKDIRLKSSKQSVERCGSTIPSMIQRLKNCGYWKTVNNLRVYEEYLKTCAEAITATTLLVTALLAIRFVAIVNITNGKSSCNILRERTLTLIFLGFLVITAKTCCN